MIETALRTACPRRAAPAAGAGSTIGVIACAGSGSPSPAPPAWRRRPRRRGRRRRRCPPPRAVAPCGDAPGRSSDFVHAASITAARSRGTTNIVRRIPSRRASERRSYSAPSRSPTVKPASRCCNERYTVAGSVACRPTRSPATVLDAASGRRGDGEPATAAVPRRRSSAFAGRRRRSGFDHLAAAAVDELGDRRGQLDRHVALHAVSGLGEVIDADVRQAPAQLGLVGVVDDRLGAHPAGEHHRDADPPRASHRRSSRRSRRRRAVRTPTWRRGGGSASATTRRRAVRRCAGCRDAATPRCAPGCARSSWRGSRRSWRTSPGRGRSR